MLENKRYSVFEKHTPEEERAYYERTRARMLAMGYYMPPFGVEAESIVVSPKICEQICQSLENIRDEDPSDYDEVEFGPEGVTEDELFHPTVVRDDAKE